MVAPDHSHYPKVLGLSDARSVCLFRNVQIDSTSWFPQGYDANQYHNLEGTELVCTGKLGTLPGLGQCLMTDTPWRVLASAMSCIEHGVKGMKRGITILLVIVMAVGALGPNLGLDDPTGSVDINAGQRTIAMDRSEIITPSDDHVDPMADYLLGLDPAGPGPFDGLVLGPSNHMGESRLPIWLGTDAIFMYDDPTTDKWSPLPTRKDILDGTVAPVSFENNSEVEIHGKLFDEINGENITYFDDIGLPDMPFEIEFDGDPITTLSDTTGNHTTVLDPFIDTGNGTFMFILEVDKPADEYELKLIFDGWPVLEPYCMPLNYTAVIYVNHPTLIDMDLSTDSVTVGNPITISGSVSDDTGRPISSIPLQIRFDDVLIGPSSDGVYIDDVRVQGTGFFDDFENDDAPEWKTYAVPSRSAADQWARGNPSGSVGPLMSHSGSNVYGTNLYRNYDRGAWSYLVTPSLDFTEDREYSLSFWAWWSVYWAEDLTYVLASEDGGATWDDENPMLFMGNQLISGDWNYYEFNVTRYVGSDNVKIAIVFYSIDKTLDVRTDGTFAYQVIIPMATSADSHRVTVLFKGNLLFRLGQAYEDIDVKRITHFEFETNMSRKVGHRNAPVLLIAYLLDNMGEVPSTTIRGNAYFYQVTIYWDKTWTIADSIGGRVGPPRTMDEETGEVSINYIVDWNETLGPHNVTFRFPGDDYYTSVQMTDIYYVKAETYIWVPGPQERNVYRGRTVDIHGELRIVVDQSIGDSTEPCDPISGEFIKVMWNDQPIGNRRTNFASNFSVDYLVPSTHELGDVEVTFEYEGQSLFDPVTLIVNYTVASDTFLTLEDQTLYKGNWVWINGTIVDDKGVGVANLSVTIIWKSTPELGRVVSDGSGRFSLQHFVSYNDKIGNISVIARFHGNKIYTANEAAAVYTIKVGTILLRWDETVSVIRGEQVEIRGKIFEDWGGEKGVEVQREFVTLLIDEIVVNYKRTAFDGSVTFLAPIEPDKYSYGETTVELKFSGTEFYESSRNVTLIVIKANSILTFAEFRVMDEIFDPNTEVVWRDEETYGRILLQDDNFQPVRFGNVTASYKDQRPGARKVLIAYGITDSQGYFAFNWTFRVDTIGTKTFVVEYEGLRVDTFVTEGDHVILPSMAEFNISYDVPNDIIDPSIIITTGDQRLTPGSSLELAITVRHPDRWYMPDLTYFIVDPPEGMEVSSDGTVTWTPEEDQLGRYTVIVVISDGVDSQTSSFEVNVVEVGSEEEGNLILLIVLFILSFIVVVVVIMLTVGSRKSSEQ